MAKYMFFTLGLLFTIMLILSFTTWPYWRIYDLATCESEYDFTPDIIVVMGGSGMPSKSALIRTYHAAKLAKEFPASEVLIALPDSLQKEESPLYKMKNELKLRGVKNTISFESKGTNTRSQSINIWKDLSQNKQAKLLIVSAPEHMYRSIKSFKKVGFKQVGGHPAFESDLQVSLDYDSKKIGGNKNIPDIGKNKQLRYQFWNHLIYEVELAREYFAIFYYYLNDWI
jgi:uncharacterized SAM-binding protein YcdF (DUF218 family)